MNRSPCAEFAPSINQGCRPAKRRAPGCLAIVLLLACVIAGRPAAAAAPQWPELAFQAASIEYAGRRLDGVEVRFAGSGAFQLAFQRLEGPEAAYLGGGLALTGQLEAFSSDDQALAVAATVNALGFAGRLGVRILPEDWRLDLEFTGQDAGALAGLPGMPAAAGWIRQGRFDAALDLRQTGGNAPELDYRFAARELSFDSPEGRYAAENLQVSARGTVVPGAATGFVVDGALQGGELLLMDFYRDFGDAALGFGLAGRWAADALWLDRITLDDGGALIAEAAARIGRSESDPDWSLEVSRLELAFPAAYRRYLESSAAVWTLDGLEVTGQVTWSGQWDSGALAAGDLEIGDFSIVDVQRGRFAVTGLEAHVRPGDHAFDSRLRWQGLLLGDINLGAGTARLDSEPGIIALVEPLRLDVLGGRLDLSTLRISLPGGRAEGRGEPDIRLEARLEELDMSRLTTALGWPEFGGTISGEIPGVALSEGVLTVDGEIRFAVFDGLVSLKNLSVERAFGVLPSLAADIEASNLDLQQLTSTFSFGRIAGRLDGHVSDLRMLDWEPVAFDAWLGTPAAQTGSKDISRQAVNRLTAIGGGSPTAALANPVIRLFSNFSYRRLGLGCALQNNVCHLRGLSDDGEGVLLLEGAGVPKITIRAFNRNIDWPQMVSNLV
ncbi:MAG: hypothetical protein R3233_04890, partial [Xanthomonadales bacterium]|nr:hypothetical protein [Xanthomonadales bacterium]